MNEQTGPRRWWIFLATALAVAAFAMGGCGQKDLCAEVDCDFGTCEPESGECINEGECRRADDCVPGYECEDFECSALQECSEDDDCEAGLCEDGACVNPESCEENEDCLERTFCAPDGTCQPDPCNEKSCQRGVCERGTGECISEDECTPKTEWSDCASDQKCADGTCVDEEELCEALDCERGECSRTRGACINAEDCEGDDDKCLDGYFCNDDTCQPDLCARNDVSCASGTCQAASGACEVPDSCSGQDGDECGSDHVCLNGTCRHEDTLCGDDEGHGGCPGLQECVFEDGEAECVESDACETSIDCVGQRQCGGQKCLEPQTCRADEFEPNDDVDEATDFLDVADEKTLDATLCEDDVDAYTFDSGDLLDPSTRGDLVIDIEIPDRNRGLGEIEAVLTNPDGTQLTESNGPEGEEGLIRFERYVDVPSHGEFTLELVGGENVKESGVTYDLSINILPETAAEACDAAEPIVENQRLSDDTAEGISSSLGSECLENGGDSLEQVYEVEVDAPQELTFQATPTLSEVDLSMSVRESCAHPASEVECVDDGVQGEEETMTALLDEGTHYLIVQGTEETAGGPFDLLVEGKYTGCTSESDFCSDAREANQCTSTGGRFDTVDCELRCDPNTGRCEPPAGNTCADAPLIEPSEDFGVEDPDRDNYDTESIDQSVDLAQRTNEYEMTTDSACYEDDDVTAPDELHTDGADGALQVTIPAETALTAHASFAREVEGTLSLVEDCAQIDQTCQAAASETDEENPSIEELIYSNFSEAEQTLYLIVDSDGDRTASVADVELTYTDIFCEPEQEQCSNSGNVEACLETGNGFEEVQDCGGDGCADGACLTGESCDQAIPAADGYTDIKEYDGGNEIDPYAAGSYGDCTFDSILTTEGHDYVYRVDLEDGETLDASYTGGSIYTVMYLMGDCHDSSTCIDNVDPDGSSGSLSYTAANGDETIYVVVDRTTSASSTLDYDLSIDIN